MAEQKVLVVDDEPDFVETIKFELENEGYQVIVAVDGVEALEKAHLEEPDLILLDIVLPKIDGYQVCRALKKSSNEKFSKLPIIMVTARDKLVDEKMQATCGANDYVVKPFEPDDMLLKIEKLLASE